MSMLEMIQHLKPIPRTIVIFKVEKAKHKKRLKIQY